MSTPKRIELCAFAVDADGNTLVEIFSRGMSRRRLRVWAKYFARLFGVAFAVGTYVQRAA